MPLNEDKECAVCFQPYSRRERIPRILHCKHTFCSLCLQTMARTQRGLRTVCCPLCRRITCTRPSLSLPGALWVNTNIWDEIQENQQEEEEEEKEEWMKATKQTNSGLRLKLQSFLRTLNCLRQHENRVLPIWRVDFW